MPRSKELNKQASEKLDEARSMRDKAEAKAKEENRAVTTEERTAYMAVLAESENLREQAKEAERFEVSESWADGSSGRRSSPDPARPNERTPPDGQSRVTDDDLGRAFRAWSLAKFKPSEVRDEDVEVCKRLGIHPGDKEITIRFGSVDSLERRQRLFQSMSPLRAFEEARALTTQAGGTFGSTIAPLFNANIESALLYYGPMMQEAEIIRTATGADLPFLTDNETTKTGSYVGENTAISTAEDIDIATTVLKSYNATTNAILVPHNLFRDTAINLVSYISAKFGERLGRFINTESTTGSTKARGLMTRTTSGKTTASSTAIAMDEIINLIHSVDKAYRDQGAVMMHDNVAMAVRLLKNGMRDYLWSNGVQNGQPDRLHGFRVAINNDMASSLTSGAKSMAVGQLNKQKIRMVEEIRITQTDQRYWEYDQVGFAAYIAFDSDLIDAGTHPVKHMTQV